MCVRPHTSGLNFGVEIEYFVQSETQADSKIVDTWLMHLFAH